jgi:hypothetical protein
MQMNPRIFGLMIMPQPCASRARGVEEFCSVDDFWKMPGQRLRCGPVNFQGILFLALVSIASAEGDTALDALKLLPKETAKRLARIEARDAAAIPERWYFIVHDPVLPRGMREFVVAGGKVVASRELSQFAESVSAPDVIGGDAVKIDSDCVARLADLFAEANGSRVGSLNFELAKDVTANAPVWRATVLDAAGDQLGVVTVHAVKGEILGHDGLQNEPSAELLKAAQPGKGLASRNSSAGKKSGLSQPLAARVVRPTPKPKSNVFRRIFGADERKPSNPGQ